MVNGKEHFYVSYINIIFYKKKLQTSNLRNVYEYYINEVFLFFIYVNR